MNKLDWPTKDALLLAQLQTLPQPIGKTNQMSLFPFQR